MRDTIAKQENTQKNLDQLAQKIYSISQQSESENSNKPQIKVTIHGNNHAAIIIGDHINMGSQINEQRKVTLNNILKYQRLVFRMQMGFSLLFFLFSLIVVFLSAYLKLQLFLSLLIGWLFVLSAICFLCVRWPYKN